MPLTAALHCDVALAPIVEGVQVAPTEVIGGGAAGEVTVTVAVPDLVVSCVLVAVTVTVAADAGAVKSPLALMMPPLADHVTAELKLPVPWTVALHCDVASLATVEGVQVTPTEVMVGGAAGELTVTVAVPDLDVSCVLVAVTVTVAAEAGAVKSPLALMAPALAAHVTAGL